MKKLGGPTNPEASGKVVGGKLVQLRPAEKVEKLESPPKTVETSPVPVSDEFDKINTGGITIPENVDEVARGANVRARLAAMKGQVPIKDARSDQVRIRDGTGGKILDGSLTIESPRGLQKLEGVAIVNGDVTLQETRLSGADVTPVNSVVQINGRLTIEGVSS
jgi:hypothetical protein